MKKGFFILALTVWLPWCGWGQRSATVGIHVSAVDCSLNGIDSRVRSRGSFSAGLWGEWNANAWLGVKGEVSYLPRGGRIEGVSFNSDFIGFCLMPRFHVPDIGSGASLLAGAGGFTHLARIGGDGGLAKSGDVGACFQLGVEWRRLTVCIDGQFGLTDVVGFVDKSQHWMMLGVGVEAPFIGRSR